MTPVDPILRLVRLHRQGCVQTMLRERFSNRPTPMIDRHGGNQLRRTFLSSKNAVSVQRRNETLSAICLYKDELRGFLAACSAASEASLGRLGFIASADQ